MKPIGPDNRRRSTGPMRFLWRTATALVFNHDGTPVQVKAAIVEDEDRGRVDLAGWPSRDAAAPSED